LAGGQKYSLPNKTESLPKAPGDSRDPHGKKFKTQRRGGMDPANRGLGQEKKSTVGKKRRAAKEVRATHTLKSCHLREGRILYPKTGRQGGKNIGRRGGKTNQKTEDAVNKKGGKKTHL